MKYIVQALLLILFSSYSQIPQGDSTTVKGLKIIFVEGDHYSRGLGYGYFAGEQIKDVALNYYLSQFFSNYAAVYNYYLDYFKSSFEVEQKYADEAGGIIKGMKIANIDLYSDVMGRDLDSLDILFANAVVDLRAFYAKREGKEFPLYMGCSSLTSFGESTLDDPELNGETVITRLLDWTVDEVLTRNQVMVVHRNTVEGERNFVTFGFAGMMGGLSIISDSGLSAFHNVGNYYSAPVSPPFHPMHFTIRNAVEADDYNGDGWNDASDVFSAIQDKNRSDSYIIETAAPASVPYPSLAVEVNNKLGAVSRDYTLNDPVIGQNLITTNHHRKLYDPIYCYRYENLLDSIAVSDKFTVSRNREVLCACAGHGGTYQAIQFVPSRKRFSISASASGLPGHLAEPAVFYLDSLFAPTGINEHIPAGFDMISAYPNPFNPVLSIELRLDEKVNGSLTVYDLKGSVTVVINQGEFNKGISRFSFNGSGLNSGIYFIRFKSAGLDIVIKVLLAK